MDMTQAFPSDFLKASDLNGREVSVEMSHVEMKDFTGEQKPVLYFNGKDKGMVLNKTNCNTICDIYGPDSKAWKGQSVTLFPAQTDYQGRQVACVRVKIAQSTQPVNDGGIPF